jgi:hypothetical protein
MTVYCCSMQLSADTDWGQGRSVIVWMAHVRSRERKPYLWVSQMCRGHLMPTFLPPPAVW